MGIPRQHLSFTEKNIFCSGHIINNTDSEQILFCGALCFDLKYLNVLLTHVSLSLTRSHPSRRDDLKAPFS